jgi:hypothetical protein
MHHKKSQRGGNKTSNLLILNFSKSYTLFDTELKAGSFGINFNLFEFFQSHMHLKISYHMAIYYYYPIPSNILLIS